MQQQRFVLHVDPVGDVLAAARSCEADVFLDTYGNTADEWAHEYGPYDRASVFIAITDPSGDAVGCARLIMPGPAGFKSLVDTEGAPWFVDADRSATLAGMTASQTCDIATLAVRKKVAGAGVLSAALYHAIVRVIRSNGLRWAVMIMDARARRLLSMLSLETHVLPGTMAAPYLGSPASLPIFTDVPYMMAEQRRSNIDGHRLINDGLGFDNIVMPGPTGYVISSVPRVSAAGFVPQGNDRHDWAMTAGRMPAFA